MNIRDYFNEKKGVGVLSTADSMGKINLAIYATPHVFDDGTIGFIMAERLSHHNLQSNPYAAYMFIEDGAGYKGVRLYLEKDREEKNSDLLFSIRRRPPDNTSSEDEQEKNRYLVFFKINKTLPLIGDTFSEKR